MSNQNNDTAISVILDADLDEVAGGFIFSSWLRASGTNDAAQMFQQILEQLT